MDKKGTLINLAFESSCDDFSCAILSKEAEDIKILSNIIFSQDFVHGIYGGVVPELASRNHIKAGIPALHAVMESTGLSFADIGMVSATSGPGLIGSILIGLMEAKTIAYALEKPIVTVNHIEGHIFSPFMETAETFPFISLVISGGHSHIYMVKSHSDIKLIGKTRDDACGELFDKVSNYMGYGYPGGKIIDELSEKGNREAFKLTLPMEHSGNLDMSFSGLKTAVISLINQLGGPGKIKEEIVYDIFASLREAVSVILMKKVSLACDIYNVKTIAVSGGVSANSRIRNIFSEHGTNRGRKILFPPVKFSTDNAAMIGYAAYFKPLIDPVKNRIDFLNVNAVANWEL